ncbi:anion permease [bacterium (Candidatus Blackallbacteria) CG17_big_fil_post_rev_8_21_14_2_50_48_46]|uniref:Anion permease n=1 Tax=bacterium (Candidatus Blackallbacteria) CG17_big_fil_post_rev_8_21_14_2_50_48_46 TaxID=2014261 RepID=A0A2M7GB23_9BACT|nr:MAG: anion permease [bacterium (Candidatus Blackallbacteria) CG18_big_fil_WC_8_21_14_2_50_49_26]PIW19368.1 MAG: anion permease [bacterium (Candidatus Blackallbacteria) CG17_big_fil_post_rev_8_21_14_2_50_48_46]PIW49028.1 MAG: anion permease [bacterium (Candidatus Blackallbacteria) CG13_big_fil_rev_8_21_14_2_50_49_14]
MLDPFILLVCVVIVALIFDYINGFHDTANSIATVVSTRVLRPSQAVMMAAGLNLLGAFLGVEVAKTIGKGMVAGESVTQITVLAALIGAIIWNLLTWYFGIPSSSSHALIGALCGSAAAFSGLGSLNTHGLIEKVFLPMVISPTLGLIFGFLVMTLLYWMLIKAKPGFVNRWFSKLQLASAGFMALSHGSNDAQKTMGIITMALLSYYGPQAGGEFHVPFWVILSCAMAMGMGTLAGGWKIIHTMGSKMIKLQPIHGFAAETSAAIMILTASHMGMPVSTTHVISSSIMGVGASKRFSAVRWGIVGSIVWAWVLTFPLSFLLGGSAFYILNFFFHKG